MAIDVDDGETPPPPPTPETVAAGLRLGARTALALVIAGALIAGIAYRAAFFPWAHRAEPQPAEHLPLPAGILKTLVTEVALPAPHENIRLVKKTVPSANSKTAAAKIDWKKTPITAPVPGAYIVIYLAQKAVGLVVDGQYIRTYYNIGLPADVKTGRLGNDGRPPIGNYFIVSHDLPRNQMKLRLSFPSPADAAKLLAAKKITQAEYQQIVNAAKQKKLPSRLNPVFGSPVYISGDNRPGIVTHGDIAIAPKEMLELWTAVRDGTIVMIRP